MSANGQAKGTTFSIDEREIDIRDGETIFRAASRLGIKLPHLCYAPKPGYRPDGNCRVCMVETEGERGPGAAGTRRPRPGMKGRTQPPRARPGGRLVPGFSPADQRGQGLGHDPDSSSGRSSSARTS